MHTHQEQIPVTDNVVSIRENITNETQGQTDDTIHEAKLTAAAIGVGAGVIGLCFVSSDLLDNKFPSEVIAPTIGTALLLGASYYLQPYLSQSKIGKRIDAWAAPMREAEAQKMKRSKVTKKKELEERDLKRQIKQSTNTHKLHDNKVKLFY